MARHLGAKSGIAASAAAAVLRGVVWLLPGLGGFWDAVGNFRGYPGGVGVDPVTLIVAALVAGAAAGLKDTASSAVKDAYNGLKGLARRRLAGHPDGELVLARHEQDPQVWDKPLAQELTAAGAGDDPALVAAAQALMRLVDAAGSAAGRYAVAASGHAAAAGRDMTITSSGGGIAAGVIHGNVAPPGPTVPGPARR
jgi:hypothetical protein